MYKHLTLVLFALILFSCQNNSFDYKVIQYKGTDSLNANETKEVKFNEIGLVKSEIYRGYKTDVANGTSDVNTTYLYNDTLLIETLNHYPNNPKGICCDSSKTEFFYNSIKQLEKRKHYNYQKRLKKNIEFKDVITSEDYEPEPTWKLSAELEFKYNDKGQKTERHSPIIHWDSQNRFLWEYYDDGKIKQEKSLDHNRIIWIKDYEYNDNGYHYTLTWYDYHGKPKKTMSEYFGRLYEFLVDSNGNEIEEKVTNGNGNVISRKITEYNKNGKIKKTVVLDKNNIPSMTHIYQYK
ncbi:hypothetical protein [uncultured Winogradskyella sp.]|uniref:hypothetical protein n=1 Tax=uncultured Winogradskyella sp. TaxID=395353 RepID=UPI00262673A1|nr:hypothetical protein [uncultured Winogradskyella sp.]